MPISIEMSVEDLRKRKIMVGTPMYGGQAAGMYTKSSVDLATLATKYEMDVRFFYLFNESLITRARNYIADEFMRSDCTHLMFIDSDIGFDPNDVLTLAALSGPEGDDEYDIICGPYPKKCISWEKIKAAVDKGFADEDPEQLSKYVGDYVFNPAGNVESFSLDEPVEVLEAGTGFMMIRRQAFEKFKETYPQQMYKPDHVRTEAFDGSREIMCYFDAIIDEKSRRYLSEDYMFCQWAREAGLKVWYCPWMKLAHMGSHVFSGSLPDIAAIGASATADVTKIGKQGQLGPQATMPGRKKLK